MKQLFILLSVLSATLFFSNCNNAKNNNEQTESEAVATTYSVDQLLEDADALNEQTVTVEGVCTHICAHGGRKIFLMGSDDTKTIRIESNDKIGAFAPECVNSMVNVTGKVIETRIDEAYLAKWEVEMKAQTTEKHGEDEGTGCSSEQKAQNEQQAKTVQDRIDNFRKRIAEEQEKTGKAYLSFYHIEADTYEITK